MRLLLLRLVCWCAASTITTSTVGPPSALSGQLPRLVFDPPVFIGNTGFEDNRAHAGNFNMVGGVLFGDSGGNMARLGPKYDTIFTSHDGGATWDSDNAALFPLDGRQVFNWGGTMQCIATGMCSSQPLTDLLTPTGIHNVTVIEVGDGRLHKRHVVLPKPIRLFGFHADWPAFDPKHFGGSMVIHTLASGTVLMTFDVGFAGSGSWAGGPRASLLVARSTDGGRDFHFSAVIANASLFAGKRGNNSARLGTLTGATEHDVVELSGGGAKRLMAVWRMGAGDGCGKEQFNFSFCLAVGGYMPFFKAYSTNEGISWSVPEPISQVDPPGCARPWMVALGDTVLLAGGRQRFANTTDVSLWASNDGGDKWERYSLSGWHNLLVQRESYGGLPARFSERVNSTISPRETSSYTSLIQLQGGAGALVMYDHIFYEFPDKPPASPFTGKNFNNASIFSMRLRLQAEEDTV